VSEHPPASESIRNRELRRADWRFLDPGVSLERIELPAFGSWRSAIGHHPAGQEVYLEWRRPQLGGGKALRTRLEAAGLEDVELYWRWPGFGQPWFWLPLGSEAATRYVAATRLPARHPMKRVINAPLTALWRRAAAAERLWPLSALARVPGGFRRESLRARIERDWELWGLGARPARLSWMLLTRGGRSINKVVALVFAEPDPLPRIAVKLARTTEAELALHREARALAAVHARTPGLRGVPRVLFCDAASGVPVVAETALPGRPLFAELRSDTYRDLALVAVDWLVDLAGPLAPGTAGAAAEVVHGALQHFAATFGGVVRPDELEKTERILGLLAALPTVPEHRDFSPWNVHRDAAGGIVVHDWESAEPVGLPLMDLVYFLTYLAFFQRGASDPERCTAVYRESRDPTTALGAVHADAIARYTARVKLDSAAVRGLHLLTWLIHARSEHVRFAADAAGPPAPTVLSRSLFLALWREELHR
jgi:hypothetical protein